jgi:hypothetical protein
MQWCAPAAAEMPAAPAAAPGRRRSIAKKARKCSIKFLPSLQTGTSSCGLADFSANAGELNNKAVFTHISCAGAGKWLNEWLTILSHLEAMGIKNGNCDLYHCIIPK